MAPKQYYQNCGGLKLPAPGFGSFDATDPAELPITLNAALELGYRHIDTAYIYRTEAGIGKVLKQWFDSGKLKREDVFITTKLPMMGIHPDRVDFFMKKSLENLGLDYVDLYLIHFPVGQKYDEKKDEPKETETGELLFEGKTDFAALWKKMEEQVDAGRAKTIGLSNFNISQIETVLKVARIKPANLQIEIHVYWQQAELISFCRKHGISVTAYSPLGSPGFNKFLERSGMEPWKLPDILSDPVIKKISQKHKKTSAQVALKFLLQLGVAPIPKSSNLKEVKENFDVFDFELDPTDVKELTSLHRKDIGRVHDFHLFPGVMEHPDYPFLEKLQ